MSLELLRKSPVEHAWVIQDHELWPAQSRTHWGDGDSYLHLTGHPACARVKAVLLHGQVEPLLAHLPEGPFVIRETPAALEKLLRARLPGAEFYPEQRMIVHAAEFRPVSGEGVRRVTPADLPAILAFTGAPPFAAEAMKGWIQGAVIFARFEGDRIASLASTMIRSPAVWHLVGIETKPEFRGRGFAAAVTSALAEHALRESGAVTLTVLKSNEPALRLYAKLGFRHFADQLWIDNGAGSKP